ncbi:uncharacterized protein LOC144350466 [Saccoglossus kowalevskii]
MLTIYIGNVFINQGQPTEHGPDTQNQTPPSSGLPSPQLSDQYNQPVVPVIQHKARLEPKIQKPNLPVFAGDVREYWTFREDFRHMVDPLYDDRNAISILRTSLTGKPLEMLKGIGTDYDACWEYLDLYYGDPRIISDAVTQDIMKFRSLKEGEDSRFCDLAHLVRRCYNILKQVGKESDLNNNHMLAIIEMKLTADDRKVWARKLQHNGEEASLEKLLSFLTDEMKTRMRATAPVRSSQSQGKVNLSQQQSSDSNDNSTRQKSVSWKKCWGCESNDHWPDQCTKIRAITVDERLKMARENHVCFSCLKRAGKNHTMRTCNRRKRCSIENCQFFHHSLLHPVTGGSVVSVASKKNDVALPIITARIGTRENDVIGNIMLDSGANVTLVRGAVAEKLGLEGKPISIDIGTLGGNVQAHQTKIYKLKIFSNQKEHTISAVGVPEITTV